jgi:hypothetical protein
MTLPPVALHGEDAARIPAVNAYRDSFEEDTRGAGDGPSAGAEADQGRRARATDAGPAASVAGLLLAARVHLARLGLRHPSSVDILAATGASRTRAYARRAVILRDVACAKRRPGRPAGAEAAGADTLAAITRRALAFLMRHPGAVSCRGRRRSYSDAFRRFVLALCAEHQELGSEAVARAVQIPATALRAWQRRPPRAAAAARPRSEVAIPRGDGPLAAVAHAWVHWDGSFTRFCEHVQRDLGIPWKCCTIAARLAVLGVRQPGSRARRRIDARAPRGSFATYFPGAQWISDGSTVTVLLNAQRFRFNLQLVIDAASGAVIGASVGDHEDGDAVVTAFHDAVATIGEAPLALLLDQRSCNRSAAVEALGQHTDIIYAARGRPQSKAHVEGAFGLMSHAMPPIHVEAGDPRELARQILALMVQCWARTLNHRPRPRRGGLSRAALYRERHAGAEVREQARAALRARAVRSRSPRRSGVAARSSAFRDFARQVLAGLGLADVDRYVETVLGSYPPDIILGSVAVYQGKAAAGTLPAGAGARYLLGIARRIAENEEGIHIADALWRLRAEARAHVHTALEARKHDVLRPADTAASAVDALLDEALAAGNDVEARYWLAAAASVIQRETAQQASLYRRAARRIHASSRVPHQRQLAMVRALCAMVITL